MEDDTEFPPEAIARITALLEKKEQEINDFFVFPDWFPEPSKITYQILLSNLVQHFGKRWPNEFQPSLLRGWINHAMEFYATPDNPEAGNFDKAKFPTDFESLELPLIFELARCEYGANLPEIAGLTFLANKAMADGYKSASAFRQREDYAHRLDFQALFNKHKNSIRSIADIKNFTELSRYRRIYEDRTLRTWVAQIAPGHLKGGRPKKS